jgi:hypothetical protein
LKKDADAKLLEKILYFLLDLVAEKSSMISKSAISIVLKQSLLRERLYKAHRIQNIDLDNLHEALSRQQMTIQVDQLGVQPPPMISSTVKGAGQDKPDSTV